MLQPKRKNSRISTALLVILIVVSGILVGFNLINTRALGSGQVKSRGQAYKYHIAMIVNDTNDVFWQSVYRAARDLGRQKDMYIESFGSDLSEEYSLAERLEMAIDAKVDGIIVEADGSAAMQQLIDAAGRKEGQSIPVITIGTDATNSKRQSFISDNDYALGEMYGNQLLSLARDQEQSVTVLLTAADQRAKPNLIYSGMSEVLAKSARPFKLSALTTKAGDDFGSEEKIRNLLLSGDQRPDILVCLNAVDTTSAYQCLVEFNLVGKVQVIGNYISPETLEGIKKGIIHSTIAVNAGQMGAKAADGMAQYLQKHYVSEYIAVKADLITKQNVDKYLDKDERDEKAK